MRVHDVDLRLLRIFVAIVESGGLAAAESRLNIGRSTISSHLADLEIRLGVTLCKRGRGGFEITESGRVAYQASLELLRQCEAFAATVASAKNELSGRATISIIETLASDPKCGVASTLSALMRKSDHLQFDINVCEAREVETSVINGRALVGIGVSRHHIKGLDYWPLHNESNYLYCANQHPLFSCEATEAPALLSQAEVVTSHYTRDSEHRNDGLNYNNRAIAYQDEGIAHFILSGEFIGYLPEHFAQKWVDSGTFKAILPHQYHYQIPVELITKSSNVDSPLAIALVQQLKTPVSRDEAKLSSGS